MNSVPRTRTVHAAVLATALLFCIPARAQAPAASVTAINAKAGIVTGKVNASGQQFQFTLNDRAQLWQLRLGQGVYVNFKLKEVSLDGRTVAGVILSVAAASGTPGVLVPAPNVSNTPAVQSALTPADFSITFASNSPTSAPGGSNVTYTLNLVRRGNFKGTINLSAKSDLTSALTLSPSSVFLGCATTRAAAATAISQPRCNEAATATLTVFAPPNLAGPAGQAPTTGLTQLVEVDGSYTAPSQTTATTVHSARISLTSTGAPTSTAPASGPPVSSIMINEFGPYRQSPQTPAFLELFNASSQPYDLKGHFIVLRAAGQTTDNVLATFQKSTPVPAGGFYLLTGNFGGTSGIFLLKNAVGTALDAVAFGGIPNPFFSCPGVPVSPFTAGSAYSAARIPDGTNTNRNQADFIITKIITPGAANQFGE